MLTLYQLGMGTPDVEIPMTLMLIKEVIIKGSFRYGVSYLHIH